MILYVEDPMNTQINYQSDRGGQLGQDKQKVVTFWALIIYCDLVSEKLNKARHRLSVFHFSPWNGTGWRSGGRRWENYLKRLLPHYGPMG